MLMYAKFIQTKEQANAGISCSIAPMFTKGSVKFKSRNSINLSTMALAGLVAWDEALVDVTERQNTYTKADGTQVTEWQLSVVRPTTNRIIEDRLLAGVLVEGDKVVFAEVKATETPARIGNTLIETKTMLTKAEYDAKLAECGTDAKAIEAFEAKFDTTF